MSFRVKLRARFNVCFERITKYMLRLLASIPTVVVGFTFIKEFVSTGT